MELIVDFPHARRQAPPPPPRGPPGGVRFAPTIQVKIVEDLSAEYGPDLFYSREDVATFRARIARQVRVFEKVRENCGDASEYARMLSEVEDTGAFLGLEGLLAGSGPRELLRKRREHAASVLFEQRRQAELGVRDAGAMAGVSAEGSRPSRRRARIIGLLHATKEN